jgi:uncharacterized protein YaiL (DUF2058 family)
MSNSLRDQLLGLGYKPAVKVDDSPKSRHSEKTGSKPASGHPQRPAQKSTQRPPHKPGHANRNPSPPRSTARTQEEIDLAKAYALRAQKEKDERIAAEQAKQEAAKLKREAKVKLVELIKGKILNVADAEHVRHFEYGGKIRRVHVTPEQLKALNAGELGVIQMDGRYSLVPVDVAIAAREILASHVALLVDPNAPAADDPYSDPLYQVPDDLIW